VAPIILGPLLQDHQPNLRCGGDANNLAGRESLVQRCRGGDIGGNMHRVVLSAQ